MWRSFFDVTSGSDSTYEALRAPEHPNSARAREYFETLWSTAAPFLDDNIRANARAQFHQSYWEVYLTAALLQLGIRLVPRAERGRHMGGPDLLQREPRVYYEAIALTPGATTDAVTEAPPGVVRDVPDDAISLRLTSGLSEKVRKYVGYREKRAIAFDVPYVIAINAGAVPGSRKEMSLPRIVRTVFPIGNEILQFDSSTGRSIGCSYGFRPALPKHSGASVSTCFFDEPNTDGISAILYSSVDPFNWPESIGSDFVLVYNPHPSNVLPRGGVPGAWEFWIEGDRLRAERARERA